MEMVYTIMATHGNDLCYCGHTWEWSLLLWLLMGMASATVDTHWRGSLLLLLLMGMTSATVDTQGNDPFYSCYSWECPLLLLKHMGMVSTIVATHRNDLCYC